MGRTYIVLCMQMILYYCLNLPKVYTKNLIYLIHTVKTGVSLSTQVKLKFLFSIRQADLLNLVLDMEMKLLNYVSNCKYLGIWFSSSGSYSYAQNELYKKSLKAFFKLKKDILSLNPNIRTSMHVFDHTIKPILLYGSDIWGMFNPSCNNVTPVTNLCLGRATTRSHSSQWSKKKSCS